MAASVCGSPFLKHRICLPILDRILKLEKEFACLEYHVLNMSMNTAARVEQGALVYCVARL
jgi:hypothetical protein